MTIFCPKCHRPFSKEEQTKVVVNTQFAKEPVDGGGPYVQNRIDIMTKKLVTYKYGYKCKHCGNEWFEFKAVEEGRWF